MSPWFRNKALPEHVLFALISCALFASLLAYAAPFGTHVVISFGWRLAIWFTVVCGAVGVFWLYRQLADRALAHWHPAFCDVLLVVLMCLCLTPAIYLVSHSVQGSLPFNRGSLQNIGQYVGIVTAGLCVVIRCAPGLPARSYFATAMAELPEPAPAVPWLARRLPEDFEGPILRLTVEDHFVEVISEHRTCRLRMRFSDAVNEMEPVEGFCTHRSHWVARAAVIGIERQGNRLYAVLINGEMIPVSRKYRENLEQAGLV